MATARGPTAGGRGCCCCCRGRPSHAPRRFMARPPGSGPEQVTWCRDRPPPEAPPSRPPPAGPAAARGATCRRRCCRTRRRHGRSSRRRPRSPSRAPAPPHLPVPVLSLPSVPGPARLPAAPSDHQDSTPPDRRSPSRWGRTPVPPSGRRPPPAREALPRARLPFPFLSSPPRPPYPLFLFASLSPPYVSLFSLSALPLSPLFRFPSFFSLSPFLSPSLLLFFPPAFSQSHPLLLRGAQPSSRRCNGFCSVVWCVCVFFVFFFFFFWRGRHSRWALGECAPWSGAAQRPGFWPFRTDFDPCQPPPVHLQGWGSLPARTLSARVAPHPARWVAAGSGCFPRVLCRAAAAPAAALFVLIVQSLGAQSGLVFNLYPCAPAPLWTEKKMN